MQRGPSQIFIELGLCAARLSFFFVFLSNSSVSAGMFVLQLNSAFSCLLQSPSDLSALLWTTKAPHFHCLPAIRMLATCFHCLHPCLPGMLNSSQCFHPLYTIYRDQSTGSEFTLAQRVTTNVPAAFTPTPSHLQLSRCPRQMSNCKVKKLSADGKSRIRGMP